MLFVLSCYRNWEKARVASDLEKWARIERQHITDELKWFGAGAVLTSPSGENITRQKVEELEARLEHANSVLQA